MYNSVKPNLKWDKRDDNTNVCIGKKRNLTRPIKISHVVIWLTVLISNEDPINTTRI